jgi:two-component system, cell cycle response regulator
VLPETAEPGAVAFAERLRERVAAHVFRSGERLELRMTLSIGVATFPSPRVDSAEDLFSRADAALYRAKVDGRDQVRT